jgi:hypothetical protein
VAQVVHSMQLKGSTQHLGHCQSWSELQGGCKVAFSVRSCDLMLLAGLHSMHGL